MKKLFGTDGMRGLAGEFPFDVKTIETVGRSLARQFRLKLGREPRFITGCDTRESGVWIEKAFHTGAVGEGADCESAEIITTPGVAFTCCSTPCQFSSSLLHPLHPNRERLCPHNDLQLSIIRHTRNRFD